MSRITTSLFDGNVSDVSFDVAVPTLNPTELGGSTGSLSFSTRDLPRPQTLRNKPITISNGAVWSASGRVSDVDWGLHRATNFQAETALQRLNITASIKPSYAVTETAAMNAALASAGFVSAGLATTGTVTFPGWTGTLLDYIKHFCNAFRKEYVLSDDANTLIFRDLRTSELSGNKAGVDFGINDQTLAQTVEVLQYTYTTPFNAFTNIEFTPAGESDPQIVSVNAGETAVMELKINGWVASVNQPVASIGVGPEARTDSGAYQVLGSDGLPVQPGAWLDMGGSLVVETTDDPTIMRVSVTAPNAKLVSGSDGDTRPSPYSIAVNYDDITRTSLHITGKGVLFKTNTISVATGVPESLSQEPVGATIDNPFLSTPDLAWNAGVRGAQYYAGANQSMSFSMADTQSISDVLGARIVGDAIHYRVNSVSYSGSQYSVACSGLVTVGDFDTVWSGKTFGDFDAFWAGHTISEFDTLPLDS